MKCSHCESLRVYYDRCYQCGWQPDGNMILDMHERTAREEGWMRTDELFARDRPEPAEVVALRILQETAWDELREDLESNPQMRFFNPELRRFCSALNWEQLVILEIGRPFSWELSIPEGLTEGARTLCREIRNMMRQRGGESCGGCVAFHAPSQAKCLDRVPPDCELILTFDGGDLASFLNPNYEDTEALSMFDQLMNRCGYWFELEDAVTASVFKNTTKNVY